MTAATAIPRPCRKRALVPRWLITFADLMALLFALFVMLQSFSEIDANTFRRNAGPISRAFHSKNIIEMSSPVSPTATTRTFEATPGEATERTAAIAELRADLVAELRAALQAEIGADAVAVETRGETVVVRFPDRAAFPPGGRELAQEILPALDRIAAIFAKSPGRLLVAGHTDDTPIGNDRFRSNWDLSTARAVSVVHRLLRNGGIDPSRVEARGFADTKPLAPNDSDANRAANRRVEIAVEVEAPR